MDYDLLLFLEAYVSCSDHTDNFIKISFWECFDTLAKNMQ